MADKEPLTDSATEASLGPLGDDSATKMVDEIVPLLTARSDLDEKLRLVARQLSVGAGFDAVNLALFSPEAGKPLVAYTFAQASEDLAEAWNRNQRADAGPHPMRLLLERVRRPVILNDPCNDEHLLQAERDILRAADLRSALVSPMIWQDQVIGFVGVASKREAAFAPLEERYLANVASQVAAITRIAALLDEISLPSGRPEQAHAQAVVALAAAAEAHDRTTAHHVRNVRELAEALALELGYDDDEARNLGLAAVLHDIGKIRLPHSILASTGPLTDDEWELMKRHTTWGAQLLAGRPGLELAAVIAQSHHERWEGGGYPQALSHKGLPEAAAIVTVADSFDSITHDRPYRQGRTAAQALIEIVAGSGRQFNPEVVAALLRLRDRDALPVTPLQISDQQAV